MMYTAVYLFLGLIGLLLESTCLSYLPSGSVRLEWIWILVLFLGFSRPLQETGPIILVLGLMEDILGTPFIGLHMTIYFAFVCVLRAFIAQFFYETLWARLLWVGIFSIVVIVAEWGLLEIAGHGEGIRGFLISYSLLQALSNMVLAAVLWPLLDRLEATLRRYTHVT